jgi:hypothetical protein
MSEVEKMYENAGVKLSHYDTTEILTHHSQQRNR